MELPCPCGIFGDTHAHTQSLHTQQAEIFDVRLGKYYQPCPTLTDAALVRTGGVQVDRKSGVHERTRTVKRNILASTRSLLTGRVAAEYRVSTTDVMHPLMIAGPELCGFARATCG